MNICEMLKFDVVILSYYICQLNEDVAITFSDYFLIVIDLDVESLTFKMDLR